MKKKQPAVKTPAIQKKVQGQTNPVHLILLMSYLAFPVFLNGFSVLDANGPKFLVLGVLNLISLFVFLSDPGFRSRPEFRSGFFKSIIGIVYSVLIFITLLSFFKAINVTEAMMNFSRVFTVFASAYMLFVIFSVNRGFLAYLVIALNLLLLFDSGTVFYNVLMYIQGDVRSIMDIKSVYSHKNVVSAAMFVKLPAAIYLIFFSYGWRKILGYVAGMFTLISILLLSARAFYLGIALLMLALLAFALIRYFSKAEKGPLRMISTWGGLFILAIVIYTAAQQFLFPKNQDTIWNTGIITRLSSINPDEMSAGARLTSWSWSWLLIQEHPLLGVGTGNWKVEVLKHENPVSPDFSYSIKNHNDFFETTAETGIFGGLAFLALFVIILYRFLRISLTAPSDDPTLKALFIPAFGILAYSVDAFFNFPADRPEMQTLFALYLALAAVYLPKKETIQQDGSSNPSFLNKLRQQPVFVPFAAIGAASFIFAVYLLVQNTISLHYQLLVRKDNFSNKFSYPASFFLNGFPSVPNLTCLGEPIVVNKARYLIHEEKFQDAIDILKKDNSSPYDSRCDYYLSFAYDKLGVYDSAIHYGKSAYRKQPLYGNLVMALSSRMYLNNQQKEGMAILDGYLEKIKTNPQAYLMSSKQHLQAGDTAGALLILDSAAVVIATDTNVANEAIIIRTVVALGPYKSLFEKAQISYREKRYAEALSLLNEFIANRPEFTEAYEIRAYCLFFTGKYQASINDINMASKLLQRFRPELINLRGVNYLKLGQQNIACNDFKFAMRRGISQAAANYKKYCENK